MKQMIIVFSSIFLLLACGPGEGDNPIRNDGINVVDSNGGLADTPWKGDQSAIDTSKMEHRTGTSKRDTFDQK